MGKPMTIQPEDDAKIEFLKKKTGAKTKIEVLRSALKLLEADVSKRERIKRWRKAVQLVGSSGLETLKDFESLSRIKRED